MLNQFIHRVRSISLESADKLCKHLRLRLTRLR
jgi:hypothetical protein